MMTADHGETQDQETAFFSAAGSGDVATVARMLEESPELIGTVDDDGGDTALHRAAWAGHVSVTKVLLAKRRSLALAQNLAGNTPLHYAVRGRQPKVAELIAGVAGASDVRNGAGRTPHEETPGGEATG